MEHAVADRKTASKIPNFARIPPRRGQIKVGIFKLLVKKMKKMASELKPRDDPKSTGPL